MRGPAPDEMPARLPGGRRVTAAATTLALVLTLLVAGAGPAGAAFPGTNGKIAFDDRTQIGEARISTVNPDGGGLTDLTDLAGPDAFAGGPVWSPDGTRLAFWSLRDGNVDVFVMSADGSGVRRLTNDPAYDIHPSWSPDGTKIAFTSNRDGNAEIYTMDADGSGVRRLTYDPARDTGPAWSPGGTRIAFDSERDGNGEIYSISPVSTGLTNLTNFPEDDVGPSWSPDGTRIAFSSLESGDAFAGIYTMNADGSGQRRLTNPTTGGDYAPAWSPDGTKIAFGSSRDYDDRMNNNPSLYVMNSDGTGQTVLMNGPELEGNANWQPIPRCTIVGTQGNDKLRGTTAKDVVCGLAGNDAISGAEGDDILVGGKGDDILYGGADNDTLNGGPGTDTASYLGAATTIEASLTTNFATGQGSDVFVGIEDLTGSAFADTLEGSSKANVLEGLGGGDALKVRDGRDNDTADGGAGSDACQRDPGDTTRSCP